MLEVAGAYSTSYSAVVAVVACLPYSFDPSEKIVVASYSAAEEQTTIQKYQVGFPLVAVEQIAEESAAVDRFAVDLVRHTFAVAAIAAFAVAAFEEHMHSY